MKLRRTLAMLFAIVSLACVMTSCTSGYKAPKLKERIEWATKVSFPTFSITEYKEGEASFQGDYEDEYIVAFDSIPPQSFYDQIEKRCRQADSHWCKADSTRYLYTYIWGNGTPDPDGKLTDEDAFMTISLEKGARTFTVKEGMW